MSKQKVKLLEGIGEVNEGLKVVNTKPFAQLSYCVYAL
jgi:hypothetical protein